MACGSSQRMGPWKCLHLLPGALLPFKCSVCFTQESQDAKHCPCTPPLRPSAPQVLAAHAEAHRGRARMRGVYLGSVENKAGFFPIRDKSSKW